MRIALSGRMLSGKSSIANVLMNKHRFFKFAFADAIKARVAEQHGITVWRVEQDKDKYREELQLTGERAKLVYHDDLYWSNILCARINDCDDLSNIVVDDCRFPYELKELGKLGFIHVCVDTLPTIRLARGKAKYGQSFRLPTLEHVSETALDNVPPFLVCDNNTYLPEEDRDKVADMLYCELLSRGY